MTIYDPIQSHDQNIKTLIVENAWAAITFAMPKCLEYFQREPEIEPIREETLKTFLSDSFLRMDVPLLAKYESTAFIFLVEHQHGPYKFSIHQLDRYVSHLEEEYERDVIPIVYFPNASAKVGSVKRATKSAFMGKRYHYFTYEALFLKDMWAKKYLDSNNIIARLMLPFMRYSSQDWLEVLDGSIKGVNEIKEVDMVRTIFEQKRLEGEINEGRQTLLLLLPQKLGPTPPEIEGSIRALTDLDRIHSILTQFMKINNWHELRQLLNGAN